MSQSSAEKDLDLAEAGQPITAGGIPRSIGNCYLDEAGDHTIFNAQGRVIVGEEGCSRYCMLGLVDVADPPALDSDLRALRRELLADPYFKGIPSFDPARGKTARFFHAKDDLPEVRREVYRLLLRHDLKFAAVVSDKTVVHSDFIVPAMPANPAFRYRPNDQYDYHVRCLLKGRLHRKSVYNVHCAARAASDSTAALRSALVDLPAELNETWKISEASELNVTVHRPESEAGCQAVDYFLWAVQRTYERREDRFLNLIMEKVSAINDRTCLRDQRHGGTFYTRKRLLTVDALKGREG